MTLQHRQEYDVAIVGGGLSGLTAAYELHKHAPELNLLLLEANPVLGGQIRSASLKVNDKGDTDLFDLGGTWLGKMHHRLMRKLNEVGVETMTQYVEGEKFIASGQTNGELRSYYDDNYPYDEATLTDGYRMLEAVGRDMQLVPSDAPFTHESAHRWANMTAEQWREENGLTRQPDVDDMMEGLCDCFEATSTELSALYLFMVLNSCGSLESYLGLKEDGAQGFRVANTSESLCTALWKRVDKDRLHTKVASPVARIEQDVGNNNNSISLTTKNGETFLAGKVILATPPTQTARIDINPPLPKDRLALLSSFTAKKPGAYRFIMTYPRAFWREKGQSGVFWTDSKQEDDGAWLPWLATFDVTTVNGHAAILGCLKFFHDTDHSDKQTRIKLILRQMERAYGTEVRDYIDYTDHVWKDEEYSKGVATLGPNLMTEKLPEHLRKSVNGLHFAGTHTATKWIGYMEGAIQAGERAAGEVLTTLGIQNTLAEELST